MPWFIELNCDLLLDEESPGNCVDILIVLLDYSLTSKLGLGGLCDDKRFVNYFRGGVCTLLSSGRV